MKRAMSGAVVAAERLEDMAFDMIGIELARDALDDIAGQRDAMVGIGIWVPASRSRFGMCVSTKGV